MVRIELSSRPPRNKLDGTIVKHVTRSILYCIGCLFVGAYVVLVAQNNPIALSIHQDKVISRNSRVVTNQERRNDIIETDLDSIAKDDNEDEQCRFYLSESAITNGGLGPFTVKDIAESEEAQSTADICIHVADTPSGTHFDTHSWSNAFLGQFEGRSPRTACEGFATLFNTMPIPVRTSTLVSMHHHTNGGLSRYKNPGAGAITQYYGITSKAARYITAGSELTIDYGDWTYDDSVEYVAPRRDVEWIRKYGICIDNIQVGPAKLDPEMGRSAFARYNLKRGTRIVGTPVQMFRNRSDFARQVPEALFINYCFQPDNLDLFAFPYGPGANLINHASDPKRVNVKIKWSDHYLSHNQWLDLSYDEYWNVDYPGGLIIDYIAVRDIQAGEELFMDYGQRWQQAWKNYTVHWQPFPAGQTNNYMYVEELLEQHRKVPFRTVSEQKTNPYPPNVKTVCWTPNWDREKKTTMDWYKPDSEWPEGVVYCNILRRFSNGNSSNTNNRSKNKNNSSSIANSFIGEAKTIDEQYLYDVSLLFNQLKPDIVDRKNYVDRNVPHSAISFVEKPYRSDLHSPYAFRHPIGMPPHMVPSRWITTSQE